MPEPPDSPIGEIIGIAICLIFSAFFSGTETALTALSRSSTQKIIDSGNRWAPVLQAWIKRPNRILTTLLVGNNLVNILGSILAGRLAYMYLENYAEAVAVACMTLLILILSEVTPKTYAKHHAEKLAVPAMYVVRFFYTLFYPITWCLWTFSAFLIKIFGGKRDSGMPPVTEGDIEYLIELGQKQGVFEEKERGELLTSALEFGDTITKEVMIPRTEAHFLQYDMPLDEALSKVVGWGHSRVPVYRKTIDEVIGILFVKDLLKRYAVSEGVTQDLTKLMRTPVLFVPETQKISEVLQEMQKRRNHLGVVVDEFGGTAGLITIEDILEELVGEIQDEYDREEDPLKKVDDHHFTADAGMSIFDLGDELGVEFPDDGEYESIGGFLTSRFGSVPEAGASLDFSGLRFKVTEADERHISNVEIRRLEENQTGEESEETPPE
ncbi:hemolysin family protein [Acidobacteriota bacterium]